MKVDLLILAFFFITLIEHQDLTAKSENNFRAASYDSTYGFVSYDSNSFISKMHIFSGDNIYKLLKQDLIIKEKGFPDNHPRIDFRSRLDINDRNDSNTIYKCCDHKDNGGFGYIHSRYDSIKDLKFQVTDITLAKYYAPWLDRVIDYENNPQQETYIITLKPSNNDPEIYYWLHPYTEYFSGLELNGYIDKLKNSLVGNSYVLTWIPYELSDSSCNISDKWTCKGIVLSSSQNHKALLENSKGMKTELEVSELFPSLKSKIYTEAKADYFLKKYKKKLWEATLKRELTLGMPSELILEIWRYPNNIAKRLVKGKTTEKWEYSDGSYLILENGKLTEVFNTDD